MTAGINRCPDADCQESLLTRDLDPGYCNRCVSEHQRMIEEQNVRQRIEEELRKDLEELKAAQQKIEEQQKQQKEQQKK